MKRKKTEPEGPKPIFDLGPPNEGHLAAGGGLARLRRRREGEEEDVTVPKGLVCELPDSPTLGWRWLEAEFFEHLCEHDSRLKLILNKAQRIGYSTHQLEKIRSALTEIFEEQYLQRVVEEFMNTLTLIVEYTAAKKAYQKLHREPEEPDVHEPG